MDYKVIDGVAHLGFKLSQIEKDIMEYCCFLLEEKGFKYLSIPSTITPKTFKDQEVKVKTYGYGGKQVLAGSAEQGILQYFADSEIKETTKIYAENTCFRVEEEYEGLRRLREFKKVEQFVFCKPEESESHFEDLLENGCLVLKEFDIKYRIVDMTTKDSGYHILKKDIEVWTEKYGWLETHSCTYFGHEQSKRFGITGINHTVSCTGIALPRALIPIIERMNINGK